MSRRWSSGWALGLLLLSVLDGAYALYFTVLKKVQLIDGVSIDLSCILTLGGGCMKEDRCFVVDVPAQTTVRAEYESPDTTDVMVGTGVEYLIGLNSRGLISCVNGQKTVLTIYSLDLGDDALVDEATGLKVETCCGGFGMGRGLC